MDPYLMCNVFTDRQIAGVKLLLLLAQQILVTPRFPIMSSWFRALNLNVIVA